MVTDLPGKKSQDITVILCLVDLQHRLHCGLHVVWDWTENRQKDTPEFKTYMQLVHRLLRLDHVRRLPDSVEDVHRKGASLHCQNSTRVLVGVPGFVQVEEVMEFLQMKLILRLVREHQCVISNGNFLSIKKGHNVLLP